MYKNDEREIQCFDCRLIQTKIFMTEEDLKSYFSGHMTY